MTTHFPNDPNGAIPPSYSPFWQIIQCVGHLRTFDQLFVSLMCIHKLREYQLDKEPFKTTVKSTVPDFEQFMQSFQEGFATELVMWATAIAMGTNIHIIWSQQNPDNEFFSLILVPLESLLISLRSDGGGGD